ncbi:hypothetical protein ACXJJ3_22950 [Kribbella sp. WER1]
MTIVFPATDLAELEQLYCHLPALIDFSIAAADLHGHRFFEDLAADLLPDRSRDGYEAVLREVVDNLVVHRHPRRTVDGRIVLDYLDPSPRIAATLGLLRAELDAVAAADRRALRTLVEHELVHIRLAEQYGVPETIAAIDAHGSEDLLESLRSVTVDRIHRAANARADFESLAAPGWIAWDIPDTAVPVQRHRAHAELLYVESGAESEAQRRARLAKHDQRVKQELERLRTKALKQAGPELQPHLKEALQRIERSEGRTAQELRRQLEQMTEKGPNRAGAGSVGRLINTANRLFRDKPNGIDLVQKVIAYGRELESTWKGFGGSYTDPKPAKAPQIADDWFERAQREMAEQTRIRQETNMRVIREQQGISIGVEFPPRDQAGPSSERSPRAREPRERDARGIERGGRGD